MTFIGYFVVLLLGMYFFSFIYRPHSPLFYSILVAYFIISLPANLPDILQDQEKELILDALEKTKWNRTAAARLLGVSFRTLRYKLKKLDLE